MNLSKYKFKLEFLDALPHALPRALFDPRPHFERPLTQIRPLQHFQAGQADQAAQDGPKTASRPPKTAPRWPPRRPKTAPRRPKTSQDGPKSSPKTAQDDPRRPQEGPRGRQDGPGKLQDGLRCPQNGPRRPQDGPRRPEDGPRRPQAGAKTAQEVPKTAPIEILTDARGRHCLTGRRQGRNWDRNSDTMVTKRADLSYLAELLLCFGRL